MPEVAKHKSKILIIDDEPVICQVLYEILDSYFSSIQVCSDSSQASELLSKNEYDLILSDVMMPNLSGSELIRIIRSKGVLTPVIFITGQATKETLMAGIRLGVSDIIEKPFDSDVLVTSVRRLIEIEKRKVEWILAKADSKATPEQLDKKRKMIGLFLVSSEKQKVG